MRVRLVEEEKHTREWWVAGLHTRRVLLEAGHRNSLEVLVRAQARLEQLALEAKPAESEHLDYSLVVHCSSLAYWKQNGHQRVVAS